MLIISAKLMEIINERETEKKQIKKEQGGQKL